MLTTWCDYILVIIPWDGTLNQDPFTFHKRQWSWLGDWTYLNTTCLFPRNMSTTPIFYVPMKPRCNFNCCGSFNPERKVTQNIEEKMKQPRKWFTSPSSIPQNLNNKKFQTNLVVVHKKCIVSFLKPMIWRRRNYIFQIYCLFNLKPPTTFSHPFTPWDKPQGEVH